MRGYAYIRSRKESMRVKCFRLLILWLSLAGLIYTVSFLAPGKAHAHDSWSDGKPVPAWVKNACCRPDDVPRGCHAPSGIVT
jgi:hypothetical protein